MAATKILVISPSAALSSSLSGELDADRFWIWDERPGPGVLRSVLEVRPAIAVVDGIDARPEAAQLEVALLKSYCPDARIIVVSGCSSTADAEVLEQGVFYYVAAPSGGELVRVVESASGHTRTDNGRRDMRTRGMMIAIAASAMALAAGSTVVAGQAPVSERTVTVEMVDVSPTEFAYSPAELTVRRGDVVRFVQRGIMPHNVEFRGPLAESLGEARMGPYLVTKGQIYEVVIDGRFAPGDYPFVCTPHETMGMIGTLTVTDG